MKTVRFLLAFAAVFCLVQVAAAAQKHNGPKYDAAAEVTLKGVVEELKDYDCPISGTVGSHIVVRTADGAAFEVHLAPAAFMKDFGIVINKGDAVEVTGAKFDMNGASGIMARQVSSAGGIYTFRNQQGRPLW